MTGYKVIGLVIEWVDEIKKEDGLVVECSHPVARPLLEYDPKLFDTLSPEPQTKAEALIRSWMLPPPDFDNTRKRRHYYPSIPSELNVGMMWCTDCMNLYESLLSERFLGLIHKKDRQGKNKAAKRQIKYQTNRYVHGKDEISKRPGRVNKKQNTLFTLKVH